MRPLRILLADDDPRPTGSAAFEVARGPYFPSTENASSTLTPLEPTRAAPLLPLVR